MKNDDTSKIELVVDNKPVKKEIMIGGVKPSVLDSLNRMYNTPYTEKEFQDGLHDWDFGSTYYRYNKGEISDIPKLEEVIKIYSNNNALKIYKKGAVQMALFRKNRCSFDLFAYIDCSEKPIEYKLLIRSDAKKLACNLMDKDTLNKWFWDVT